MAPSTASKVRSIKKALAEAGACPFEIAAEALARAERLEAEVRRLNALLAR